MLKLFEKLAEIPGGSGFEEKVIGFIAAEFKRILPDVSVDSMGNVIGKIGKGIVMLILTLIGVLTAIILFGSGLILIAIVSVWVLIDLIKAIIGRVKDKEGKLITRWSN